MMMKIETNASHDNTPEERSPRSPIVVPAQYENFARSFSYKNAQGLFLGNVSSERESLQRAQFCQTRHMAKTLHNNGNEALEPTAVALNRTKQAAKDFFTLSYQLLSENNLQFPLAGFNKCLGMVVVPTKKLVLIATSQDKNPVNDELLRSNLVDFIGQLNQKTTKWVFELVALPTKAQYLMPRTLFMSAPHMAPQECVEPHTRCVEVALMAALCKAGRTLQFTSSETGIIAFGGTLWASSEDNLAIPHFEGADRNKKYTLPDQQLEVILSDTVRGWIDIWKPCDGHCKIYKYEMLAIGAAGGPATSFTEPRAEQRPRINSATAGSSSASATR